VVEATSHGLAQDRVGDVAWDVAVHTNVTHEHLEFHRTPEAYRAAKRRLFERLGVGAVNPEKGFGKHAVVNTDDPWVELFRGAARAAGASVLGYGAASGGDADVQATAVREGRRLEVTIRTHRWQAPVRLALAGRYNVHNALAAVGVGEVLGLDPGAMRAGLESLDRVPGRMESVDLGQPFRVFVDYAHSPEALGKALDALAPPGAAGAADSAVFGSAGDRDTRSDHDGPGGRGALSPRGGHRRGPGTRTARRSWTPSQRAPSTSAAYVATTCCSSPTGRRPSPRRSTRHARATWCCSPARATSGPSRWPRVPSTGMRRGLHGTRCGRWAMATAPA